MKKELAQVRIYKKDRDKLAVEAKRERTTIAEIINRKIKNGNSNG